MATVWTSEDGTRLGAHRRRRRLRRRDDLGRHPHRRRHRGRRPHRRRRRGRRRRCGPRPTTGGPPRARRRWVATTSSGPSTWPPGRAAPWSRGARTCGARSGPACGSAPTARRGRASTAARVGRSTRPARRPSAPWRRSARASSPSGRGSSTTSRTAWPGTRPTARRGSSSTPRRCRVPVARSSARSPPSTAASWPVACPTSTATARASPSCGRRPTVARGRAPAPALPMSEGKWDAARDLEVRSLSFGPTGGLIAAGGNDWQPVIWQSTDGGVTWAELPDPVHGDLFQDGVSLRAAASLDGVTVALGAEPSVLRLDRSPLGGRLRRRLPAQRGTTVLHGGRHRRRGRSGGRDDRRGWPVHRIGRRGSARRSPVSCGAAPATGGTRSTARTCRPVTSPTSPRSPAGSWPWASRTSASPSKRQDLNDSNPDGLLWLSRNGTDWARWGVADARVNEEFLAFIDDPSQAGIDAAIVQIEREAPPPSVEPAGGDGTRSLEAVSALGDGFIAVGSIYVPGDADPIILISPDGTNVSSRVPAARGPGHPALRRRVRRPRRHRGGGRRRWRQRGQRRVRRHPPARGVDGRQRTVHRPGRPAGLRLRGERGRLRHRRLRRPHRQPRRPGVDLARRHGVDRGRVEHVRRVR